MAEMKNAAESRPTPDPTILTTEQSLRGLASLREIIEARLDGMDTILGLLQTHLDHRDTAIATGVKHLQDLIDEKFKSIATQFIERDTRTEQTSRDSKVAVDAALQAAKEAVGEQNKSAASAIAKSEAATTKQIDAIGILISTTAKASDDKIDDLKTRLTTIEGHSNGSRDSWAYLVGAAGVLIAFASLVVLVLERHAG